MALQKNSETQSTILGKIIGFILGVIGFLFLFKVIILDHTPPSDELAPGMVVILSFCNGILFAFFGHLMQKYFNNRKGKNI